MGSLNLVLWVAGAALIALGYVNARGPYRQYQVLRETDQNLRRYDDWRGGRREDAAGETGADVMRRVLLKRAQRWAVVALVGGLLLFAGFVVR